jgi:hypothetical protein
MFAEHYQFYVYDGSADPGELSIYWDEDSRDAMVLLSDNILGIGTVRHLDVPVTLEVYEKEPETEDLEEYDHVLQCTLNVPSGKLVVSAVTEDMYEAQRFDVAPGVYGVRIYYGALEDIDEQGFEGEDFYKVAVWPTDSPPEYRVLKQWDSERKFLY